MILNIILFYDIVKYKEQNFLISVFFLIYPHFFLTRDNNMYFIYAQKRFAAFHIINKTNVI